MKVLSGWALGRFIPITTMLLWLSFLPANLQVTIAFMEDFLDNTPTALIKDYFIGWIHVLYIYILIYGWNEAFVGDLGVTSKTAYILFYNNKYECNYWISNSYAMVLLQMNQ